MKRYNWKREDLVVGREFESIINEAAKELHVSGPTQLMVHTKLCYLNALAGSALGPLSEVFPSVSYMVMRHYMQRVLDVMPAVPLTADEAIAFDKAKTLLAEREDEGNAFGASLMTMVGVFKQAIADTEEPTA